MKLKKIFKRIYDVLYFFLCGGVRYAKYKGVSLGDNCRIYISSWGSEPFLIKIGNNVTITSGVRILTHDGATSLILDDNASRYQKYKRVTIGDNVFIGVNSVIMPGVNISNNVIVAAGSVVTKNVASNSVIGGNPARFISTFDEYSDKVKDSCVLNSDIESIKDYRERVIYAIGLSNEK